MSLNNNRKIKVNLSNSSNSMRTSEQDGDNHHHISVGLTVINNPIDQVDKIDQQTAHQLSEDDGKYEEYKSINIVEKKKQATIVVEEEPPQLSILNIVDENDEEEIESSNSNTSVPNNTTTTNSNSSTASSNITPKPYEKPVSTPRFEELTIEEEETYTTTSTRNQSSSLTTTTTNNSEEQQSTTTTTQPSAAAAEDIEFSFTSLPSTILNFLEKMVINNKGRIEMMKSLGNLMYLGSKTRTDAHETLQISPAATDSNSASTEALLPSSAQLLNDIYETEKISTVISLIGWYQDYVADKHQLQNKKIQSDLRFSSYHKAGQYLRLLECFILVVEILFKKRSGYGENGRRNYWNLLIVTEVVKAIIKLVATVKSKTNTPLFLNYSVLPPDEQTMSIPMASLLPTVPKFSPFDKEAQSLEKFANNYKKQAKPKVGSRSGRKIPSSDQLMAVIARGNDDVPTTSELGEQLGLNLTGNQDRLVLLAPQTEELKGSLGKMLMYLADALYSIRPVVYSYLLSKYGFKSWKPFIVSLLIELSSIFLTNRAIRIVKRNIKEHSPSVPPEVGSAIEQELSRRTNNLSHYLYRGPLFEIVMERIFKSILLPIFKRIPLIGASFVGYIEYIIMIQQFYFFCNPSI